MGRRRRSLARRTAFGDARRVETRVAAWAIAFAALAGYCVGWDALGGERVGENRQLSERYARGRESDARGETAERYRRAVEEAKGTRVKGGSVAVGERWMTVEVESMIRWTTMETFTGDTRRRFETSPRDAFDGVRGGATPCCSGRGEFSPAWASAPLRG